MSVVQPQLELVDRSDSSIRYIEHGWPTDLCRWHRHEEYEAHLIVSTRGRAFVGDYIGEFAPGDVFLIGPNLPHNWVTEDSHPSPVALRDQLVQFSADSVQRLSAAFAEFEELRPMLELAESGIQFIGYNPEKAAAGLASVRDTEGISRILYFLDFLHCLNCHPERRMLSVAAAFQAPSSGHHDRIARIVDHIVGNFAEDITLADVADMAGMSQSSFSRNFQAVTGNNFIQFLTRVRIGEACGMLHSSNTPISAICYEVGFQNLSNFNRQFLRLKSMTPSEYRMTVRRELGAPHRSTGCAP